MLPMIRFPLVTALVAIAALAGCSEREGSDGSSEASMRDWVVRDFNDPNSADFRGVRRVSGAWCGEVNGKNLMGAYIGFRQFVAVDRIGEGTWIVQIEPSRSSPDHETAMRLIEVYCG